MFAECRRGHLLGVLRVSESKKNGSRIAADLAACYGAGILGMSFARPERVEWTVYGLWLNISRQDWRRTVTAMGGVVYAHSHDPVPDALADAMARFPEEMGEIKAEMDIRRQIAGLKRFAGWGG